MAATVLLTVAAVLIAALPAVSEAAFPGKAGRIVFGLDPAAMASEPEIYSIRPGGGGLTPLTDNGVDVFETDPAYSADGRRILFTQDDDAISEYRIVIMNEDGSLQDQLLTSMSLIGAPAFAPSGRTFAYVCAPSGDYDICARAATGGSRPPITNNSLNETDPAYARDGRLFFTRTASSNEIFVKLKNGTEQNLTNSGPEDRTANPSPDGRWVTFHRDGDIWLMRSDGSGQRNLTDNGIDPFDRYPAFSPTGRQIAFTSSGRLAVMSATGGPPTFLTASADFAYQPDWQPIPVRCGGKRATQVGTRGRDTLVGTPQRDVLAGLGGRDVLRGKGRNDILCGGGGPDRLIAGAGRRDRCIGGKAPDLARHCEVERSI